MAFVSRPVSSASGASCIIPRATSNEAIRAWRSRSPGHAAGVAEVDVAEHDLFELM